MFEELNCKFKRGDRVNTLNGEGTIVASAYQTESKSIIVMHDKESSNFHAAGSDKYYQCPPGKEKHHYFYNPKQLTLIEKETVLLLKKNRRKRLIGNVSKTKSINIKIK